MWRKMKCGILLNLIHIHVIKLYEKEIYFFPPDYDEDIDINSGHWIGEYETEEEAKKAYEELSRKLLRNPYSVGQAAGQPCGK